MTYFNTSKLFDASFNPGQTGSYNQHFKKWTYTVAKQHQLFFFNADWYHAGVDADRFYIINLI